VGKEIATALATITASFGVGLGLAMASLPLIAAKSSWQVAMFSNVSVSALAIVLLLSIYRDHEVGSHKAKDNPKLWRLNRPEQVLSVLAGIARGLFSAAIVVFMSFLPPLLISQGMGVTDAGVLTSVAAIVATVSVPLGGFLSDRTGKPNHFIVGGAVGSALTCVLVPYIAPAILWVLLFGFLRGGCTGGIMALPSQVLRPESRSAGFAISAALFFAGMAAFPPVAGYVLDTTANAAAPLWIAGILWFLIPVVLAVFKLLQRKWITQ